MYVDMHRKRASNHHIQLYIIFFVMMNISSWIFLFSLLLLNSMVVCLGTLRGVTPCVTPYKAIHSRSTIKCCLAQIKYDIRVYRFIYICMCFNVVTALDQIIIYHILWTKMKIVSERACAYRCRCMRIFCVCVCEGFEIN